MPEDRFVRVLAGGEHDEWIICGPCGTDLRIDGGWHILGIAGVNNLRYGICDECLAALRLAAARREMGLPP
jgi:hypothetical protein